MKKISSNKKILVIGSTGFLGKSVFDSLQNKGADVSGIIRKKKSGLKNRLVLDLENEKELDKFRWKDFDIIVDCSGYIDYGKTLQSEIQNIKSNVLIPLRILSHLSTNQRYFYCSSHTVLVSEKAHNPYSFSKLAFEKYVEMLRENFPHVTIFRLPGLFGGNRKNGLIYTIGENFINKKGIELTMTAEKWHAMYLPRVTDILISALFSTSMPDLVTVGYPAPTSVEKILKAGEAVFGYAVPVAFKKGKALVYKPDIEAQKTFYHIDKDDFERDLKKYFNSIK